MTLLFGLSLGPRVFTEFVVSVIQPLKTLGVQVLDSRNIQGRGLPFAVLHYSVSCKGRLHARHKKSDCQMIQDLIYLHPDMHGPFKVSLPDGHS